MRFAQSTQCGKFIELSREHARYCHIEEPDTLVYSGAIASNDGKPDSAVLKGDLMFVMGCTDEAAEEKHAVDPNHVALGAKLTAVGVEIESSELLQYRTTGRGYLSR